MRQRLLDRNALLWIECLERSNIGREKKKKRRVNNSNTRVFVRKSVASGFAFGKMVWNGFFFRNGKARM